MGGDLKKCWKCGKVINGDYSWYGTKLVSYNGRRYCEKCYPLVISEEEEENALYIKLKKRKMLRTALLTMERQNIRMYDYQEAIEVVTDKLESNPDKFDSSYEIIAAIILVKNKIYSKLQYKILNYQVDFYIPDIGVILEIDGERHKYKKIYDNNRDIDIRRALGEGWDVIHIKAEYLDKAAEKLPEAIHKVIEYRENYSNKWRQKSPS